jgi:DNA invertase Pin-like site-specific DNA recombinase
MFQMMGVFAEFERAMIRERVLAGLARAKEQGTRLGRRRIENADTAKAAAIRAGAGERQGYSEDRSGPQSWRGDGVAVEGDIRIIDLQNELD